MNTGSWRVMASEVVEVGQTSEAVLDDVDKWHELLLDGWPS